VSDRSVCEITYRDGSCSSAFKKKMETFLSPIIIALLIFDFLSPILLLLALFHSFFICISHIFLPHHEKKAHKQQSNEALDVDEIFLEE